MKGWVYVLSNESLDGLIKIGYSSKDPGSRAKELSGDTGVPTPFIVEYEMLVEDPYGCEQRAHKILDDKRVNQNREFFRCSVKEAIETAKHASETEIIFEKFRHEPEGRTHVEENISQPLIGLIKYMTGDGELTNHEVYHLCKWMNEHPTECDLWPGTVLVEPLNEVYADGVLTVEELQHIAMILGTIIHKFDEEQQTTNKSEDLPPVLPPSSPEQQDPVSPQRRMAKERSGLVGGLIQKYEQHNLDDAWRNELKQFSDKERQRKRELYIVDILRRIKNGTHECSTTGIFFKKNEKPMWVENAVLFEDVISRHYESGTRGTSFRIAKGIHWRVGVSRGKMVSEKDTVPVDEGQFIVTDQRLIFSGNIKSFDTNLTRILSLQIHPDGIAFSESNRKKRRIVSFPSNNGDIVCAILNQIANTE